MLKFIGLATEWLQILLLHSIDKSRNHLVHQPNIIGLSRSMMACHWEILVLIARLYTLLRGIRSIKICFVILHNFTHLYLSDTSRSVIRLCGYYFRSVNDCFFIESVKKNFPEPSLQSYNLFKVRFLLCSLVLLESISTINSFYLQSNTNMRVLFL